MVKGRVKSARTADGRKTLIIKPYKGGRDVRAFGVLAGVKLNDMVEFQTYTAGEAKKLLGESAEYPIAKSLNGRALPKKFVNKKFARVR